MKLSQLRKIINEEIGKIDDSKSFDALLNSLIIQAHTKYVEYLKDKFNKLGLKFENGEIKSKLSDIELKINNIPMKFSNSGYSLYFDTNSKKFPAKFKNNLGNYDKGFRNAETLSIAFKKITKNI